MLKVIWVNSTLRAKEGAIRGVLIAAGWTEESNWNFSPGAGTITEPDHIIDRISAGTDIHPLVTIDRNQITVELR